MGQNQSSAPISIVSNPPENDGLTWWCKIGTKGICVLGGIGAVIAGLFRCITFTPLCLVAGIMLMLQGFLLILMEAPCCCQFLDFIQPLSRFSDARSPFQKAIIYGLPAVVPLFLCFSLTTAIGCVLVMVSGGLYGITALGKKADRDTMISRAKGDEVEMKETLIASEESASVQ